MMFTDAKILAVMILLQIEVDSDGKILDAKFKTFGCGSAIASSSLATDWIKGKTVRSEDGDEC
jgi:NifU-like protein involved in Fe-S cluster formation